MEKILVEICAGTSCHLMGSYDISQVVENLKSHQRALLDIKVVSCLGKCGQGPNIRIHGETYTQVTPEQFKKLLDRVLAKGE